MQIALQFYANHPKIILFEPESGRFKVVSETGSDSTETVGWGVVMEERLYGLIKSRDCLSLIVDNRQAPLDDRITSIWHAEGRKRKIEVQADSKPLFHFEYKQEEVDELVYMMTTWDEEDGDFWLFLHNVINDRDRQARIAAWNGRQQPPKPCRSEKITTAFPKLLLALSIAIWAGANVIACSCPELFLTSGALAGGAVVTSRGRMRVYSHLALWASILMLVTQLLG